VIEYRISDRDIANFRKMMNGAKKLPARFMVDISARAETIMKQNKLSGQILHRRTGALASSIQSFVTGDYKNGTLRGVVGSGVRTGGRLPYANIHATGGIIRPKNGKYLAIPIRAGGDFAISSGMWNYKTGPKRGTAKKRISHSSKILSWRFVKQVRIPKRDYVTATMNDVKLEAEAIFKQSVEKVMT